MKNKEKHEKAVRIEKGFVPNLFSFQLVEMCATNLKNSESGC